MIRYFAYGANMDPRHMARRAPGAVAIGPARLDGFRLAFDAYSTEWDGGVANLEPDPAAAVWGVLWEVPDDEVAALHAFRGHPTFYRREDVVVQGPDGRALARTYRVAHQRGCYAPPADAYLARLRSAARLLGLPPEALDAIDEAARPPSPSAST